MPSNATVLTMACLLLKFHFDWINSGFFEFFEQNRYIWTDYQPYVSLISITRVSAQLSSINILALCIEKNLKIEAY